MAASVCVCVLVRAHVFLHTFIDIHYVCSLTIFTAAQQISEEIILRGAVGWTNELMLQRPSEVDIHIVYSVCIIIIIIIINILYIYIYIIIYKYIYICILVQFSLHINIDFLVATFSINMK